MAKLCAHGETVGTVDMLTKSTRYMSDGKILVNSGQGWKLYRKVKPEVAPKQAYEHAVAHQLEADRKFPAFAAYRKALHELCGVGKRWKLHTAVTMMPDDPDGVWSEVCDGYADNVHADLGDVVALCASYRRYNGK